MPIVSGSLANVYASLDAYLQASLLFSDGSAIALRLHGVRRFVPPATDPWIEVHYDFLGLNSVFMNRVGLTGAGMPRIASERQGYLQLNCYQRARAFATRYTTAVIRDITIGAFPEGELIAVCDYTTDPPTPDGWIVADGIQDHVADTGLHSGIVQHVIQVKTRYLEISTRSV